MEPRTVPVEQPAVPEPELVPVGAGRDGVAGVECEHVVGR